ncbi:MAG: hypoxanthine-guanine phosphoribosyltransferase [Gammaproteobacteria bacterium]|nr:hypoxanthine-guanine phosphoribosyltransferase [Gammaproteobacteria bacterium]
MNIPAHVRVVQDKAECIYTRQDIENALDRMAEKMNRALADQNPVFLCVMVGGLIPAGNLLPRLNFPLEVDYIHATRYRGATRGGELHWLVKPRCDLKDRVVLIVDDILDGGVTLKEIVNFCIQAQAKQVLTAVLLDKKDVRLPEGLPEADFTGLTVSDGFVFGYGMDYKEYLRNAPGIFMVAPEHR